MITSPVSISTQSALGMPSILAGRPVSFFTSCARWSARAATCRPERPEAMIMKSAREDFPSRSMKRISSALSSSSALARDWATARISSTVACLAGWTRGALEVSVQFPSVICLRIIALAARNNQSKAPSSLTSRHDSHMAAAMVLANAGISPYPAARLARHDVSLMEYSR